MTCDVCIGTDETFDHEFYAETTPVARRQHQCIECNAVIAPGAKYNRTVIKDRGVVDTYRRCALCAEIQRVFACGKSFLFSQLWEDMQDAFPSLRVTSPCFNQLSMEARAFLTARWWKWMEDQAR